MITTLDIGYKGNASSWSDLGRFNLILNQGRDYLPAQILDKVKELTAGLTDTTEKIRALYNYLQQNTRYISIQMGVGGWQPFEASFVATKGYGDCKALSNYMVSLLKAAGIKAYYTLVHAGRELEDRSIMEDFPSHQFNHVIVCIPFSKDTMWLECTSQFMPAGYMGSFTCNRKALVITEAGGVMVSTPKYGVKENIQLRNIDAVIDLQGNLNFKTTTCYKTLNQDEVYNLVNGLSKEKVKQFLNKAFDLSTYEINNFKYEIKKDALPEVKEQLDITVTNYASVTGKRLFFLPNIISRSKEKLTFDAERKYDYVLGEENMEEDIINIEVPEGYQVEAAPKNLSVQSKFGAYSLTCKIDGNKIIYHRTRQQYKGRFPTKDGVDLAAYYAEIYKSDHSSFVLIRKER
ncbi:MAG: hypothetical protein NVS1B13_20050 [Flavisolibacter sp.]